MTTEINIESLDDLPPKRTRGQGKWQRKLQDIEVGTVFTIEDDSDQSAISKYRSIRIAAQSMGQRTSMRQLENGKIMVKLEEKEEV